MEISENDKGEAEMRTREGQKYNTKETEKTCREIQMGGLSI
jgi:hypothetical protein